MGARELPDGRWIVYGRKGFFPDPNKTKEYFGRGAAAQLEALKRDAELKSLKPKKAPRTLSSVLVADLVEAYNDDRRKNMEVSTLKSAWYKLKILVEFFGNMEAASVTHADLNRYAEGRMTKSTQRKHGVKRTTVHRELADLKAIFSWAKSKGHLITNPIVDYQLPKKDDEIILPPTDAEVSTILKHAAPHLIRAIYISAFTGLRPGRAELLDMKWYQVDFDKETITVISAKKGGISRRPVPVHPVLLKKLKQWKRQDNKSNQEYIIHYSKSPKKKGQPVLSIKTAWRKAKDRAGIKRRLRLYDLRHAFATRLLEEGGDLKATSQILGHSRPDTTMKHYQHVTTTLQKATIKKLRDFGPTNDQNP